MHSEEMAWIDVAQPITQFGLYKPLLEFAGAGASVPLTGFGYLLSKGVREAVQEDGFTGIFTGGLKATAGGITAAITAGLLASFLFKAKDKSWEAGHTVFAEYRK